MHKVREGIIVAVQVGAVKIYAVAAAAAAVKELRKNKKDRVNALLPLCP
jgi:hypothetical protein